MKPTRRAIHHQVRSLPELRFEQTRLTPYSGLVIFQALFQSLRLRSRLERCFEHLPVRVYGLAKLFVALIVHVLLGFRRLRGVDVYASDPLVPRVVGLRRLPSVATLSRGLAAADELAVDNVRRLSRELVLERIQREHLSTVTIDFDGSAQLTSGSIEGTAVGYSKVKHGERSYFPLFATVAQTGQFLDFVHRPGNAHDSVGAREFMRASFRALHAAAPRARLEARGDSAFFSEAILEDLDRQGVEFACAVPFERMPKLKALVEAARWNPIDDEWAVAEVPSFRPTTWSYGAKFRFVMVRCLAKKQRKDVVPAPEQLDLFQPVSREYRFRVVVTNKTVSAASVLAFYNGRCAQEKIFGEAKQHAALDVIVARRRTANELFTLACIVAHNCARELQMRDNRRRRTPDRKRRALWRFWSLGALRLRQIVKAGLLTRPTGQLVLTVGADDAGRAELLRSLRAATGMQH